MEICEKNRTFKELEEINEEELTAQRFPYAEKKTSTFSAKKCSFFNSGKSGKGFSFSITRVLVHPIVKLDHV